jgi:hypothetical protein
MTASVSTALTPSQYAQRLGVRVPQILGWINSGQLRAIDVSSKPGSARRAWRISLGAIIEFEAQREAKPPAKSVPRKRKKQAEDFVQSL